MLDLSSDNAAEAILLGFQHYLVMLGTTVIIPTALVPLMGGGNVRRGKILFVVFHKIKKNEQLVCSSKWLPRSIEL